jgi:hypothetical protein
MLRLLSLNMSLISTTCGKEIFTLQLEEHKKTTLPAVFFLFSFYGIYGMHTGTDCTSACVTTSLAIQSHDESIFLKFTYQAKIALSEAVHSDDFTQFVLKITTIVCFCS